jgi:hypothetical protein
MALNGVYHRGVSFSHLSYLRLFIGSIMSFLLSGIKEKLMEGIPHAFFKKKNLLSL